MATDASGPPTRRRLLRRRTLLTGILLHGPGRWTLDCSIRDVSEGGAHIRTPAVVHLARPTVLLAPSADWAFEATVAWQRDRDMGLTLVAALNLTAPTTDLERIVRLLWLERRAR